VECSKHDQITTLVPANSRVDIDLQSLRQCFHLPLSQAAKALGTCTTSLKKICRMNKIERWPCRQIRSVTKTLNTLQRACLNINLPPNLRCQYVDEISVLEKALVDITEVCIPFIYVIIFKNIIRIRMLI
jgi:hypothetical protein